MLCDVPTIFEGMDFHSTGCVDGNFGSRSVSGLEAVMGVVLGFLACVLPSASAVVYLEMQQCALFCQVPRS